MGTIQKLTPHVAAQLRLDLVVDDITADAEAKGISPEEAMLISRAAQAALEDGSGGDQAAHWMRDYMDLRDGGWPWRVACYIAWSASPRADRWPKTQQQLAAEVLGLRSDRVIRQWREKNPAIDAAIAMCQSRTLFEHRAEVLKALVESASNADHKNHPDRKLFLEMIGDYTPRVDNTVTLAKPQELSKLSDAELAAVAKRAEGGDVG